MHTSLIAAAAAVAMLSANPALANDHSWQVGNNQFHIYYTDLDMASAAGRATMLARVERAAAKLCDNLIGTERPGCIADTVRQATRAQHGQALALALSERNGVRLAGR